ncbi:type I 3-dehydroquinate dehydratase, partial [Dietzia sp. B19]
MPRHRLVLDARSPSIIVPLTGRDLTELAEQIGALRSADSEFRSTPVRGTPPAGVSPDTDRLVDVVEWRVDLYGPFTAGAGSDPDPAVQALEQISALLPGLPVLATFRTRSEGGGAEISPEAYVALVEALASTGMAAALDVEYRHPHAEDAITAAR